MTMANQRKDFMLDTLRAVAGVYGELLGVLVKHGRKVDEMPTFFGELQKAGEQERYRLELQRVNPKKIEELVALYVDDLYGERFNQIQTFDTGASMRRARELEQLRSDKRLEALTREYVIRDLEEANEVARIAVGNAIMNG